MSSKAKESQRIDKDELGKKNIAHIQKYLQSYSKMFTTFQKHYTLGGMTRPASPNPPALFSLAYSVAFPSSALFTTSVALSRLPIHSTVSCIPPH